MDRAAPSAPGVAPPSREPTPPQNPQIVSKLTIWVFLEGGLWAE
jgi:hypothetical protein